MDYNWLFPGADARPVGDKGWGSFATEPIAAGTTVAAFGGWIVTRETLATFSDDRQGRSIQVDEDLYLVSDETPEPGDMLNHSCEPSCGLVGATLLVARRDIEVGRGAHVRLRHLRLERLRRVRVPLRRAHVPRRRDRSRLDEARAAGEVRRLVLALPRSAASPRSPRRCTDARPAAATCRAKPARQLRVGGGHPRSHERQGTARAEPRPIRYDDDGGRTRRRGRHHALSSSGATPR